MGFINGRDDDLFLLSWGDSLNTLHEQEQTDAKKVKGQYTHTLVWNVVGSDRGKMETIRSTLLLTI